VRSSARSTSAAAWYIGTVPIGTVLAWMMAVRMASRSPPVERSITVSAPYWMDTRSFSNSVSMSLLTVELPIFALILTCATAPMAIGCKEVWLTLAGITNLPAAISARTRSGASPSLEATCRMAGVTSPRPAKYL